MIDITMSDDYRAFLEEQNYNFTDFQTATLVWNDPMKSRRQKLEALALLRDTTKDIVLKNQLIERIEYENKLSKGEVFHMFHLLYSSPECLLTYNKMGFQKMHFQIFLV